MTDWGLFYVAAASLPLLACGVLLFVRRHATWVAWTTLIAVAALAIMGLVLFQQQVGTVKGEIVPWTGSVPWLQLSQLRVEGSGVLGYAPDAPAVELRLGYFVDSLTTVLFALVSVITLIIAGLARPRQAVAFHGLLLSSCGFTLHLLVADNLAQLFLCWVMVGFLVARLTASEYGGMRSFLLHRLGDAGLLVAMAILWTYTGTLSLFTVREVERDVTGKVVLEDGNPKMRITQLSIFDTLRCPAKDSHDDAFAEPGAEAGKMCRVNPTRTSRGKKKLELAEDGALVVVWNQETLNGHYDKPDRRRFDAYDPHGAGGHGKGLRTIPYWALCLAGVGIVLGCLSRIVSLARRKGTSDGDGNRVSVQLIISLVAGTYVAARLFPAFTPEVLVIQMYAGGLLAFLAAWAALRQLSMMRMLTYVTLSQAGLAWAGLGVGAYEGLLVNVSLLLITGGLVLLAYENVHGEWRGLSLRMASVWMGSCFLVIWSFILPERSAYTYIWSFVSLKPFHAALLVLLTAALFLSALAVGRGVRLQFALQSPHQDSFRHAGWYYASMVFALLVMAICYPMIRRSIPEAAAEEGPLLLHEVSGQAAGGYFRSDSWLRPLHELSLVGPKGLALGVGVSLLTIGIVWGRFRSWRTTTSAQTESNSEEESSRIQPIQNTAHMLASIDERLLPSLLQAGASLVMAVAWLANGFDRMLEGILTNLGRLFRFVTGRKTSEKEASLHGTSSV